VIHEPSSRSVKSPGHRRGDALRRRRRRRVRGLHLRAAVLLSGPPARRAARRRSGRGRERGQSTVEYALVLLGAAAVALALVAWVARSDAVSRLFDAIVGRILSQA
jgi:hypothetical protein